MADEPAGGDTSNRIDYLTLFAANIFSSFPQTTGTNMADASQMPSQMMRNSALSLQLNTDQLSQTLSQLIPSTVTNNVIGAVILKTVLVALLINIFGWLPVNIYTGSKEQQKSIIT